MNYDIHPFAQSFMQSFNVTGLDAMYGPHASTFFFAFIGVLAIWSLIWKGFALWYAGRNHQKAWFIFMLIINSAGLLEIIYLLFFRKNKNDKVVTTTVTHTTVASSPSPAPEMPSLAPTKAPDQQV